MNIYARWVTLGFVCALVLAAVFVWAAAAKLARPAQTAAAFRGLGFAGAGTLAVAVPVTELLVAVALVAAPTAGAVVAVVLLAVFTGVIIRAMRAGVTTGCACFGTTASRPISGRDLARNGALTALAVAALWA